jgi:hypothetical protein
LSNPQRRVVAPQPTPEPAAAAAERRPGGHVLARLLRGAPAAITDGAVVAFAAWTVLYHAAFLFRLRPVSTFLVWLVVCLVALGAVVVRNVRRRPAGDPGDLGLGAGRAPGRWRPWALGAGVAGVLAGFAAGIRRPGIPWAVAVAFGVIAAASAVVAVRRMRPARGADAPPAAGAWASAYALAASGGFALASLLLARNTPDDVFYVGKSVWVAQHNLVPLRDFLFTDNVAPPLSSQPPTASIEVFAGALARALGIHAASATWYVMLPVMAVVAVLCLWRLVHRWAPRRAVPAFTVALAFLALVAGSDAALGTFHLPRLYEGKGMFVSALVPLAWFYLTRWFDTRSRTSLALMVALSISAIGLTTTAAIILPILAGAAALGLVLVNRWRDAIVAFLALIVYPVGSVIVTRIVLGPVTSVIAEAQFFDAAGTYKRTLLTGVLGVICGVALWCGPLLVRRGAPALLTAGVTVTMTVLLFPGVLELLSSTSGLSAVLWRVPWILPLPALVGLICAVDPTRLRRPAATPAGGPTLGAVPKPARFARAAIGAALAAALIGAFAVFGTPMWSRDSFVTVHDRPTWKLLQPRQRNAFWMAGLDRPPGLLLAPATLMRTMPIVTSRVRVVMARDGYLVDYGWNSQFSVDRRNLAAFADGKPTVPVEEIRAEMNRLDVTTVCVYKGNKAAAEYAPTLGLVEFASHGGPAPMRCYRTAR